MSDGMSDARAEDALAQDVWNAAFDLGEVCDVLGKAIMRARVGHRGWNIVRSFIVREVNEVLRRTGFELVDRDPGRSFEYYGHEIYDYQETRRERASRLEALELSRELEYLRRAIVEPLGTSAALVREVMERARQPHRLFCKREPCDCGTDDWNRKVSEALVAVGRTGTGQ